MTRQQKHMPVIAIANHQTLDEEGNISTIYKLIPTLRDRRPTLFAKLNAADFIAWLDEMFADIKDWQWRASAHERDIYRPDGVVAAVRLSTVIHWFGFRKNRGGNYHQIIDPVVMYGRKLDEVYPGDEPRLTKLLKWAVNIRDFCEGNNLLVKPTIGMMGSQLLTDPRFYPKPRRKVPTATNERVRESLPGNFYYLNVEPSRTKEYTAYYLDQRRAHHYHARTIRFPDANLLYAYGDFRNCARRSFDSVSESFYGLYCLDLQRRHSRARRHGYYDWLHDSKLERVFLYSNEIQHVLDMGYEVLGVRAMWGSHAQDTGLNKIAEWCCEMLDKYDNAPWLKPILLASYGSLAAIPKQIQTVYKQAKGEHVQLITGHNRLNGYCNTTRKKIQPHYANVLHRGMIEAATRSDSVGMAQYLDYEGWKILAINADAVIVEVDEDKELPVLLEPWRLKETLHHYQPINTQAFISGEMEKLPGVSGQQLREYARSNIGYAPRKRLIEALTGREIVSDRRI